MSLSRSIQVGLYGAMALVGSSVAVGGEQTLTVSGLSSLSDGAYILDVNIKNNSGGTRSVHLVVNGDTTVTNYYRQIDFVDNATPTPLRQNNNHFYSGITNGQCLMAFGVVRVSRNNFAYFSGDATGEAPSGVTRGDITIAYNTAIAGGITSLGVRMDAAGFVAGDYIKVYKIGAPTTTTYLAGSADIPPAVANAKNDEFDGSSAVSWISTPTPPSAFDINTTRPHHARLVASGSGSTIVGKYQAAPASFPYTVTMKMNSNGRANYHRSGAIMLLPTAPTSSTGCVLAGMSYADNAGAAGAETGGLGFQRLYHSNMSTYSSQSRRVALGGGPWYFRVVMTSATAAAIYYSMDGWVWALVENYTVPFSVAYIGFGISEENSGGGVEAHSDWFRVT